MNNQEGVAHVLLLIIVVLGGVVIFLASRNQSITQPTTNNPTPTQSTTTNEFDRQPEISGWDVHESDYFDLSFEYPPSLITVEDRSENSDSGGSIGISLKDHREHFISISYLEDMNIFSKTERELRLFEELEVGEFEEFEAGGEGYARGTFRLTRLPDLIIDGRRFRVLETSEKYLDTMGPHRILKGDVGGRTYYITIVYRNPEDGIVDFKKLADQIISTFEFMEERETVSCGEGYHSYEDEYISVCYPEELTAEDYQVFEEAERYEVTFGDAAGNLELKIRNQFNVGWPSGVYCITEEEAGIGDYEGTVFSIAPKDNCEDVYQYVFSFRPKTDGSQWGVVYQSLSRQRVDSKIHRDAIETLTIK